MFWDLKNKIVVITGGAQGIGYAIADKYLESGAKVIIILDINETVGAEAAEKLKIKYENNKVVFLKCDVTTDIEVITKEIFTSYIVDILINSAGIANEVAPKETIAVNVTSVIEWSLKFWEHMRKDKGGNGGTIINLGSIHSFRMNQFAHTYQASKYAVMGFTKSLGYISNFIRSNVRVIALCPGYTPTNLTLQIPNNWDESKHSEFESFVKSLICQDVDDVSKAAVDIYQIAESGTAWLIEGGKPITEII